MSYNYFCSYRFNSGFGRTSILRETPIQSITDIVEIEDSIKASRIKDGSYSVEDGQIIITSWQQFDKAE